MLALILQRLGFWARLYQRCAGYFGQGWPGQMAFGVALAVLFMLAWLPFGVALGSWPHLLAASLFTLVFAVLAPLAFALRNARPRTFVALAGAAYLASLLFQQPDSWSDTYPIYDSELLADATIIADRAQISMDRVLIGEPKEFFTRHSAYAEWHKGGTKAIMSDHLLHLAWDEDAPESARLNAGAFRFVTAHEVAHLKHHHFEWMIGLSAIIIALFTAIAGVGARGSFSGLAFDAAEPALFLPAFLAIGFALHFAFIPIKQNIHRGFENQADATALELSRDPEGAVHYFTNYMTKAPLVQDRWYHTLYRTHPGDLTRIKRALEWHSRNIPDTWSANRSAAANK
ncbi:MAG: M48 family metalloprotease [Erythrobacter sp.]